MTHRRLLQVGTACSLVMSLSGGVSTAVLAQQQAQVGLEEITVTARRREESLLEVPVSVSALTAASIESRGIKSIQELSEFTPGMFSQVGGNGRTDRSGRRLTFRGLSVANGATFIDGAPYTGTGAPDVTDVARVEVLKGPQAVYFGRSTYSGAVNYVMKQPGNEFRGTASADIYSYDGFDTSLSFEGPLVRDRLSARVRVRKFTFGGQYVNGGPGTQRGKMGAQDTKAITASVVGTPNDKITVTGFFSFTADDDGAPTALAMKVAGTAPTLNCNLGGTGGAWWCGALPDVNEFDPRNISVYNIMNDFAYKELILNASGYPVPFDPKWKSNYGFKRNALNSFIKVDYAGESGWEVGSIFSYNKTKQQQVIDQQYRDASNLPNPFYPATPAALAAVCALDPTSAAAQPCFTQPFQHHSLLNQNLTTDYSVEARISSPQEARLRGTAGVSYFRSDSPGGSNKGFQSAGRINQPSTKTSSRTPAVFGGLYYDIMDDLTVSAEGRYQWDSIAQQQLFPAFGAKFSGTFKSFSPRVTLDYHITPDSMVFTTFSRGYRPGGFNTTLSGLTPFILAQITTLGSNLTFRQEKLDNFELGNKATWLDGRLRTTATVYYMKWLDGQNSNTLFITRDNGTIGSVTVTQNIGRVNMKGFELEADVAVTERFTVSATLDINDNEVVDYIYTPDGLKLNNSTVVKGKRLQQSPASAWTISPSYTGDLAGEWKWTARLDYKHRGKIFIDQHNIAWLKARDLFNIRAGVSKENFKIDFYVNNVFNDKKLAEALRMNDALYGPGTTCPPCYTAALPVTLRGGVVMNEIRIGVPVKRTFGVNASYTF